MIQNDVYAEERRRSKKENVFLFLVFFFFPFLPFSKKKLYQRTPPLSQKSAPPFPFPLAAAASLASLRAPARALALGE